MTESSQSEVMRFSGKTYKLNLDVSRNYCDFSSPFVFDVSLEKLFIFISFLSSCLCNAAHRFNRAFVPSVFRRLRFSHRLLLVKVATVPFIILEDLIVNDYEFEVLLLKREKPNSVQQEFSEVFQTVEVSSGCSPSL